MEITSPARPPVTTFDNSHNDFQATSHITIPPGSYPEMEGMWEWPQNPAGLGDSQIGTFGHSSPPDFGALPAQTLPLARTPAAYPSTGLGVRTETLDQVPVATAASFFRTYFQVVHPQYPFLSLKDCGDWYEAWKMAPPECPIVGWPAFFVKMVYLVSFFKENEGWTNS